MTTDTSRFRLTWQLTFLVEKINKGFGDKHLPVQYFLFSVVSGTTLVATSYACIISRGGKFEGFLSLESMSTMHEIYEMQLG